VSVQSLPIGLQPSIAGSVTWRSRTIAIFLMVLIAGVFWIDSRYPALMKRYTAGATISAKGSLTFGQVYAVERSMPLATRVWRTTVNWLDANRVGMTFSFLFGPAALTFLAMLRRRRTTSVFLNTLFGAAVGAPLAVCTNCIAPIARGFFASGMSTESVLAAMFASPALNVVVLAMTFVLFPMSVALLKLFTVLFLIFVFVPLAVKRQDTALPIECAIDIPVSETWGQALVATIRSYLINFWYIARVALPFMLLAAILGALVIEILPAKALFVPVSILGIVAVAIVSSFLPVPMAFDVAIAYILLAKGVPLPYCVTILCTLGIVSVFSLLIVGKTASWKIAGAAYATTVALGTAAGLIARLLT
jgi:uncharacterized membrane protein YraQ (UPF0718 family)